MTISPTPDNQKQHAPMPKSVKRAYERAAGEAWILALTVARESFEATSRERAAAAEAQLKEIRAVCSAQAAELVDIRLRFVEHERKAEAELLKAQKEAAEANRRLAVQTDDSMRAATRAAKITSQFAALKTSLQTAQNIGQSLFDAIGGQETDTALPHAPQENLVVEDQRMTNRPSVHERSRAPQRGALELNEPALIAAATLFIKTVCRGRVSSIDLATQSATGPPE
jgi:hypothetical protein